MKVKFILLFFILWLHITVLNLFVVGHSGLVFYWEESLRTETIFIHLTFALISSGSFFAIVKIRKKLTYSRMRVAEKTWVLCSLILLFAIAYLVS